MNAEKVDVFQCNVCGDVYFGDKLDAERCCKECYKCATFPKEDNIWRRDICDECERSGTKSLFKIK